MLAATIIGSAMAFIDGTITNVALPQIQERLGATAVDTQWIVEAYTLFLAALILVGGPLGDHYGRRRIFLLGVMVRRCGLHGQDAGERVDRDLRSTPQKLPEYYERNEFESLAR